jgi:hypothetical protein
VSNISFFHMASVYPKATTEIVRNAREHHPNDYYFLGVDNTFSYQMVADIYETDYKFYQNKVGGPKEDYGYRLDGTLEFLARFKTACLNSNSSHIIMMEDDVLIVKPMTIDPNWEHACADTKIGNHIPETVLTMIEEHSDKRPTFTQYGAGGGSIFKVSTFLEHYDSNIEWFKKYFDMIQMVYPTIGYIDCFMNVYYWLAGKDYSVNPHRADTHNHQPGFDYETFISNQPPEIEIINNYKKYYYE